MRFFAHFFLTKARSGFKRNEKYKRRTYRTSCRTCYYWLWLKKKLHWSFFKKKAVWDTTLYMDLLYKTSFRKALIKPHFNVCVVDERHIHIHTHTHVIWWWRTAQGPLHLCKTSLVEAEKSIHTWRSWWLNWMKYMSFKQLTSIAIPAYYPHTCTFGSAEGACCIGWAENTGRQASLVASCRQVEISWDLFHFSWPYHPQEIWWHSVHWNIQNTHIDKQFT